MKTTLILISPKIKSLKNSLNLKAFFKRLPFILMGLFFWLLFYIGTLKVLKYIHNIEFFGNILSKKLYSMTFFSLIIFLIISNTITAISAFYMSKDVTFFLSKPIEIKDILRLKIIETFINSSWMVISFLPPFFIAYGISYNAPPNFYIMLILNFIPFLLIPCSIGIILAHILTRIFPVKKARFILFCISIFLFLLMYILFRLKWHVIPESPERIIDAFLSIRIDSPLLPSFWITKSTFPLLKGQSSEIFYSLLLLSNASFMLIVSGTIGKRLFIRNLARIQPSQKQTSLKRKKIFYPQKTYTILWKDIKIFFRDASQWSQLLIISALIFIYVFNFRVLPIKPLLEIYPLIKEIMVLINIIMAGLVLSAVSARFVYTSISLEGTAFWIIKISPVSMRKVLIYKFLYGFIPVTITLLIVVSFTNIAIDVDVPLMFISLFTILILCISVSGLGTGLGAIFPKFRYENIASIAMSPGGMLFMLISFSIVILTVSLEVWAYYIYKKTILLGLSLQRIEKLHIIITCLCIFILNSLAFYIPMKIGEKCLEKDLNI